MIFPSPEEMGRAPVWENYVLAQAVQASLGLIPRSALAVGVRVSGTDVELSFQLSGVSEGDEADMDDIVSELELLVGDKVSISRRYDVKDERDISPRDGVCWFFLAHR